MAENKMASVAKLLGVEIGQEFKIKGYEKSKWVIDEDGFRATILEEGMLMSANEIFIRLILGSKKIIKPPRKPSIGEKYWSYCKPKGNKQIRVASREWCNDTIDISNYRLGFCYKTEAEAEANKPRAEKFFSSDEIINWEEQDNGGK